MLFFQFYKQAYFTTATLDVPPNIILLSVNSKYI